MPDPLTWMILIGTALLGSTIGGIAGFGAGILLLPVAAWTLGTRAAVPVLTVTMLLGNLARIWWSRGELHGGLTLRFIAGAVPTTALGVMIFAGASSEWLARAIGAFLLLSVPLRRFLSSGRLHVRAAHFRDRRRHRPALRAGGHHRPGGDTVLPRLRFAAGRVHRHRGA